MKVELIDITKNADDLIIKCARVCYRSDSNPESDKKLLKALFTSKHLSVFEHAKATFMISGISRTCSHQLVRHRMASYSQESQRYVSQENFDYILPESLQGENNKFRSVEFMDEIKSIYLRMIKDGIPKEDARAILPGGTATKIAVTMNFRSIMNFLDLRLPKNAQSEIREIAIRMLLQLKKESEVFRIYDKNRQK